MSKMILKGDLNEEDDFEEEFSDEEEDTNRKSKPAKKRDDDEEDMSEGSLEDSDIDDDEYEEDDDDELEVDPEEMLSRNEIGKIPDKKSKFSIDLESDDDDDSGSEYSDDETYLQKFDENLKTQILSEYHPELQMHNNDEVDAMTRIVRNESGTIIDPLHRTLPFVTKYERARILGERAKQLNSGAKPMIPVDPTIIDGYLIALAEFEQKKIPFIVKRPLPNGGCEYWKLKDLSILS